MNPDRKMTEEQERLSQRGLSFHEDEKPNLGAIVDNNGNDGDGDQEKLIRE